ncbi:MAG: ABC transporter permease [Polyangiaceae bacterium]
MQLLLNAIRLAFRAVVRNKVRAALTVLGVLIGVVAIVSVTTLAEGASSQVGGQIDSFAANALFINPQSVQNSGVRGKVTGRLTESDAKAIQREAPSVTAAAPFISTTVQMVYADRNVVTMAAGVTLPYFPIRRYEIAKGELWTESDELVKSKVCVIGGTVADKLFGTEDPVGRVVRIGVHPYRVLGVLARRGVSPFGEDQDDRIVMPIGSFRARILHTSPGRADLILASAASEEVTGRAEAQIRSILRQRHHIAEGAESDFSVNTQREFRAMQEGITSALAALLVGVAAVSLLVGGIGVMNIMLVSVTERTREIGIRMSIGARKRDILLQFLVEAIVLTMVGGLLGVALGVAGTLVIGRAFDWHVVPSIKGLALALGTSTAIGILFGYLPARRAANLDPIDALRSE